MRILWVEEITEASELSGYSGYYRISFDYRYRTAAYNLDYFHPLILNEIEAFGRGMP